MPFAKDSDAAGFSVGFASGAVVAGAGAVVEGVAGSFFSSLEQAAKPRAVLVRAIRTDVVNLCIRILPRIKSYDEGPTSAWPTSMGVVNGNQAIYGACGTVDGQGYEQSHTKGANVAVLSTRTQCEKRTITTTAK